MNTSKNFTKWFAAAIVSGFMVVATSAAFAEVVHVTGTNGKDHRNIIVSAESKAPIARVATAKPAAATDSKKGVVAHTHGTNNKDHRNYTK